MTENKCSWEDGLGTSPSGEYCGECNPTFAKRCPHLNKEKQIEEMAFTNVDILANDINQHCADLKETYCGDMNCLTCLAHALTAKGYRKASEVAEEIFEEIDRLLENDEDDFENVFEEAESERDTAVSLALSNYVYGIRKMFAELKKKYTEEGK